MHGQQESQSHSAQALRNQGGQAALLEALVEGLTIDTVYDERGRKTAKVTVCCRFGGQRGGVLDSDSDALGPRKPKSSPSRTEKLIRSTATTSP